MKIVSGTGLFCGVTLHASFVWDKLHPGQWAMSTINRTGLSAANFHISLTSR